MANVEDLREGGCVIRIADDACGHPAERGPGLGLCPSHLAEAYDWVARGAGITDILPSPCLACGSRLGVRYPSGWLCAICEWRVGQLPDGAGQPPRVDVVYYLRFRDRIKIGTSGNPRSRLGQLRFDTLLAFERGDRTREQRRHAQFAAFRFEGSEWFHAHPALDAHVAVLAAGVDDPWDLYRRWVSERLAIDG
jgi:hypothetical protein